MSKGTKLAVRAIALIFFPAALVGGAWLAKDVAGNSGAVYYISVLAVVLILCAVTDGARAIDKQEKGE